jgi:hypothetical protein
MAIRPTPRKTTKIPPHDANAVNPLKPLIPPRRVRPERGQHPSKPEKLRRTTAAWTKPATTVKVFFKSASSIAAVRSERGYSLNFYRRSPVGPEKSMQRQFRRKYAQKKIGNI